MLEDMDIREQNQESDHGPLDNTKNQMHDQRIQPLEKEKVRSKDFGFRVKLLEFGGTLQAEEFIDEPN